jgi:hypothetical protein
MDGDFGGCATEAEDRFETDAGRHYRIRCKLSAEILQGLRQNKRGIWRQPATNPFEARPIFSVAASAPEFITLQSINQEYGIWGDCFSFFILNEHSLDQ